MKISFSRLDKRLFRILKEIGKQADKKKMTAYAVGGFVRDYVLKRKNLDIDIVVEGDAIALARSLARKKKAKLTVYNQFGTVTVHFPSGQKVDLAMARQEAYVSSGALPKVKKSSLDDDLIRRDFSLNAMAVAINPKVFGKLIDLYGGMQDIKKRRIRVLHDKSFRDDPTRILRAVRFEQRFKFNIEKKTLNFLKKALKNGYVSRVKPARYFSEFRKFFSEESPLRGLNRLKALEGLGFIRKDNSLDLSKIKLIDKNITKLRRSEIYKKTDWSAIYFLGLMGGFNKKTAERMAARFHFTRVEKQSVGFLAESEKMLKQLRSPRLARSEVYKILKPTSEIFVCYLRAISGSKVVNRHIDRYFKNSLSVKLAVSGQDLAGMGIAKNERMGKILKELLLNKIDGDIRTRRDELRIARSLKNV